MACYGSMTRGVLIPKSSHSYSELRVGFRSSSQRFNRPFTRSAHSKRNDVIKAVSQDDSSQESAATPIDELKRRGVQLFHRYDFLSAGLGALAVTSFCVARGQDPTTALWITAASTVVALLVNDAFE